MKYLKYVLLIVLFCGTLKGSQRKVLVEVFTNAHCPLCPPAHVQLSQYMLTGNNAENVTYIFYHMIFPYPDDPLNSANREDPAARNIFYGSYSITPQGFFDGQFQNQNYVDWGSTIDEMTQQPSPYEIILNKNENTQNFSIDADVTQTGEVTQGNLVVNFVAVENVNYTGRNGISDNKFVMRKMFPNPGGVTVSTTLNQSIVISQDIDINSNWNTDELGFVVFIQDRKTKEVHQSEYISYNSLITNVAETKNNLPVNFHLSQNFPNPFNPSTVIRYRISEAGLINLKVFDVLGRKIATLVNEVKTPGNYEVLFNANHTEHGRSITSGIYFYRIRVKGINNSKKEFTQIRKMIYLK